MSTHIQQKNIEELQQTALKLYGRYELDKSLLWFVEEVGEIVSGIRKKKSKEHIEGEIGDALAWIFSLSNILDIKVEAALRGTMEKEINRQLKAYGRLKYTEEPPEQLL